MILFGHYTIPIKTYKPEELPIGGQFQQGDLIQLRVQVGHLFWIPFFPMWKGWVLVRKGEKFKLNPETNQQLDAIGGKSHPLYAFTGLFLLPLLFVGFQVWQYQKEQRIEGYRVARSLEVIAETTGEIQTPTLQDYYMIYPGRCEENYLRSAFKVSDYSQDSVTLKVPPQDENFPYDEKKIRDLFADSTRAFTYHTVAKSTLESAVLKDPNGDYHAFQGRPIAPISGTACLIIGRIEQVPEGQF